MVLLGRELGLRGKKRRKVALAKGSKRRFRCVLGCPWPLSGASRTHAVSLERVEACGVLWGGDSDTLPSWMADVVTMDATQRTRLFGRPVSVHDQSVTPMRPITGMCSSGSWVVLVGCGTKWPAIGLQRATCCPQSRVCAASPYAIWQSVAFCAPVKGQYGDYQHVSLRF